MLRVMKKIYKPEEVDKRLDALSIEAAKEEGSAEGSKEETFK